MSHDIIFVIFFNVLVSVSSLDTAMWSKYEEIHEKRTFILNLSLITFLKTYKKNIF